MQNKKWHMLSADDALRELDSAAAGLSADEAEKRLQKYGPNELVEKKKTSDIELLAGQFKNLLVLVLIFAAAVSLLLGETLDGIVISVIVVINAFLGFYQERKAENALAALKKMTAAKSTAVRDGKKSIIDSKLLVPGDIIFLNAGDKVPADCRVIEQNNVKIDESLLTGESVPVTKTTSPLKDAAMADRTNMAFSGTHVVYGNCTAVVAETGMNTEFGKIAEKLQEKREPTPLQRKLATLGRQLSLIIFLIAAAVFAAGYISGASLFEMFLVAVSLAVAAIPEGLPVIVTITLAVGLVRMSKKNAIVRRLPAVESLGSVSVICSDKTGTLTKNEMTVRKLYVCDRLIDFDAYDKEDKAVELLLTAGLLCNDATESTGDPTEIALVKSAKKIKIEDIREKQKRLHEIPFSSERKMMSVVYDADGKKLFTKGAVEEVLKRCTKIYKNNTARTLTERDRENILAANHMLTKSALRVLAFAYKSIEAKGDEKRQSHKEDELIFVGLQAMIDPPRPEVKDAIARCYTAGIKTVMITGDHLNTAEAVANELGIKGRSISGEELDRMNDEQFAASVEEIAIYARTSPEQKVRITEALKKKGHTIAMSGDGVNDAPALKKADIGIAVGSGTDVTKEAADMVLTDDNFATIVSAVEEGRGIYDNITKFVDYLLRANFAEIIVIFSAIMLMMPLPLLPLQLLWINLLTDGLPALALGLEPPDKDIMKRKPRDPKEKILNKPAITFIVAIGIIMAAGVLLLFVSYLPDIEKARTVAFTALVAGELFAALSFRSKMRIAQVGFLSNRKFVLAALSSAVLQLAVLYTPLNAAFGTVPLGIEEWLFILAFGVFIFALLEALKSRK